MKTARMIDVGRKPETERVAVARATVEMAPATLKRIQSGDVPKGDVLAAVRLAGIAAAKAVPSLIPLCHPLSLTGAEVAVTLEPPGSARIEATVRCIGRTGVEMEALTAAAVGALTLYDMCKAVDRGMTITDCHLVSKRGGASGSFRNPRSKRQTR